MVFFRGCSITHGLNRSWSQVGPSDDPPSAVDLALSRRLTIMACQAGPGRSVSWRALDPAQVQRLVEQVKEAFQAGHCSCPAFSGFRRAAFFPAPIDPRCAGYCLVHEFLAICHSDGQMLRPSGALCEARPRLPNAGGAFHARSRRLLRPAQLDGVAFEFVGRFVAPSRFLAERYRSWPDGEGNRYPSLRTFCRRALRSPSRRPNLPAGKTVRCESASSVATRLQGHSGPPRGDRFLGSRIGSGWRSACMEADGGQAGAFASMSRNCCGSTAPTLSIMAPTPRNTPSASCGAMMDRRANPHGGRIRPWSCARQLPRATGDLRRHRRYGRKDCRWRARRHVRGGFTALPGRPPVRDRDGRMMPRPSTIGSFTSDDQIVDQHVALYEHLLQ